TSTFIRRCERRCFPGFDGQAQAPDPSEGWLVHRLNATSPRPASSSTMSPRSKGDTGAQRRLHAQVSSGSFAAEEHVRPQLDVQHVPLALEQLEPELAAEQDLVLSQ